jgi:hypothetical protein
LLEAHEDGRIDVDGDDGDDGDDDDDGDEALRCAALLTARQRSAISLSPSLHLLPLLSLSLFSL